MTKNLENNGNQNVRLTCIDMATRIVGKPEYHMVDSKLEKQHDDVVKVAERIYKFVMDGQE